MYSQRKSMFQTALGIQIGNLVQVVKEIFNKKLDACRNASKAICISKQNICFMQPQRSFSLVKLLLDKIFLLSSIFSVF